MAKQDAIVYMDEKVRLKERKDEMMLNTLALKDQSIIMIQLSHHQDPIGAMRKGGRRAVKILGSIYRELQ